MRKVYVLLLALGVLVAAPWAITQAVFTDSPAIDANTFSTGTIELSTAPTTALVTYSNMAPGDKDTEKVVITNDGTLELRYAISSVATNVDTKGLKDQLSLVVKTMDVTTPTAVLACDDFDGTTLYSSDLDSTIGKIVGDSAAGSQTGDRVLAASGAETLCFRVELPLASGNAYQNAATTATFTFAGEQTANNA